MRATSIIIAVLLSQLLFAQDPNFFIARLKDNSDQQVLVRAALYDSLNKADTIALLKLVGEIEKNTAGSSAKIKARVAALKARTLFYRLGPGDSVYAAQMKEALYKANELDEPFMVAEYSRWYSEMLNSLQKRNVAVQYALNSIVLQEQLGLNYFSTVNTFYFTIGELFLRTRNYEDAIKWLNKGLALPGKDSVLPVNYANAVNNLALAYHYNKDYKNSLANYKRCMKYSQEHDLQNWYLTSFYNRLSPFIELGYYDSCKVLLTALYKNGLEFKNDHSLAGSCYMFGRIANLQKDFATALDWLKKAEMYAFKTGVSSNRVKICQELSASYNGLKQFDVALNYYKEYEQLNDSTEKAISTERSDYMIAKANFDKEQLDFRKLNTKRAGDIRLRNIGIIVLAFLSGIIIWWLNWKRRKAKRSHGEAEMQLKLFTENIISKDQQIESLRNELQLQSTNTEKAGRVEELSQQMILTEDDWQRFQFLFNKTYPGYLYRLKEKFAGITEAEIRMACLLKIHLNTKQIASMQGLSPDSVHKTRHRLRQRFSTATTTELEAILASV